jgi:hypothetical protein
MGVDLSKIPMLARRGIEAEMVVRIMASASKLAGPEQARAIIEDAISSAAFSAGQSFAAKAPGGAPSLAHFAQVLDMWRMGDALDIADVRLDAQTLSFRVTRCGYVDLYRELGLPADLPPLVSCSRDAAFAAGYSPRLTMERPQTIAKGSAYCGFIFRWT